MKEDSDKNKDEKVEKKDSKSFGSAKKFLDKLDFMQIDESDEDAEKKNQKSKDDASEHEDHAFPMVGDFLSSDRIKKIKSGDSRLITGIGIFVGALFIIFGIVSMMNSPDRVADNVVFGEKAVFSVFLILIGILIMAGVLARRFLDKSFFQRINKEIEVGNGTSSNSTKENIERDNINRNNR